MLHFSFRGFFAASSLVFVAWLAAGCAGYTMQHANSAPQGGTLALSSTSLNFQTVAVGQSGTQTLQLTNTGQSPVKISGMAVSAAQFTISGAAAPVSIPASGSLSYTVSFTPTSVGNEAATLNIQSSAAVSPQLVNLSGAGTKSTGTGSLAVSPASLNFGNQAVQSTASQTVTLTNTGSQSLTIQNVTVNGGGFGYTGLSQGVSLAPKQQASFQVTFDPPATGTAAGSIAFSSSELASSAALALSGNGVAVQHQVHLAWKASSTADVGYVVYRSEKSGGPYSALFGTPIDVLSYDDANVTGGATYFYVVAAVNASGKESVDSNQTTVAVP